MNDDEQRFARGNPWARAVRPDDEKATSPILYVLFGLLSLVLVAFFVAALVLPPMFMHSLIIRGLRSHRPGMLAAGLALAALYFFTLVRVGMKLGKSKPPKA